MSQAKQLSGKYKVDDNWHLFIDGNLREVYVESIEVMGMREPFTVFHYDELGQEITTATVDEDDLQPVVSDLEPIA